MIAIGTILVQYSPFVYKGTIDWTILGFSRDLPACLPTSVCIFFHGSSLGVDALVPVVVVLIVPVVVVVLVVPWYSSVTKWACWDEKNAVIRCHGHLLMWYWQNGRLVQ